MNQLMISHNLPTTYNNGNKSMYFPPYLFYFFQCGFFFHSGPADVQTLGALYNISSTKLNQQVSLHRRFESQIRRER